MSWFDFAIITASVALTMLACRVIPVFESWATGPWPAMIPWSSAALVFVVGYKTKSLVWCIVAGVASYALLMLI